MVNHINIRQCKRLSFHSVYILAFCLFPVFSCKKAPAPVKVDPYETPWDTQYISYTSNTLTDRLGMETKVFYKDSLLIYNKGGTHDILSLGPSYRWKTNEMYIVSTTNNIPGVIYTHDGGLHWSYWTRPSPGYSQIKKIVYVNQSLIYLVASDFPFNKAWSVVGFGKSALANYQSTPKKGVFSLKDSGADLNGHDSIEIVINDSVDVWIRNK